MSITSQPILNVLNTTLPDPHKAVQVGNFEVYKHRIWVLDQVGDEVKRQFVGDLVWFEGIKRDSKTGITMLEVIYYYRDKYHITTVSREIFNDKGLQILTKLGADIHRINQNKVAAFLRIQERMVKKLDYTHKSLGWDISHIAESSVLEYYHSEKYSPIKSNNSTYVGEFEIKPKGSYQAWSKAVQELVVGRAPLEFALVCGFSAVINSLLSCYLPLDVILVHIYGESSSGKTTASQLAVSAFGRPDKYGLIQSWNATFNAMMKTIANVHGVPVVFDEVSIKANSNITSIIYQLAEGKERKRLNADIEFRDIATWSGLLMFTGEHPATELTNQNSGIRVRMPEFFVPKWTDSAEHSQTIKRTFEDNYGHGGKIFVEHVLETFEKDMYINRYYQCKEAILSAMDVKDQFTERLVEKYAIFILTAEIMNECFQFQIDIEELKQFIAAQEAEMITTRSLEGRAMEIIEQQILKNHVKFQVNDNKFTGVELYGTIKDKHSYIEVAIIKSVMEKWIADAGFSSKSVVAKQLKAKGILDHEVDRHTRKRKVPMTPQEAEKMKQEDNEKQKLVTKTMYVLKLPKEFMSLIDHKANSNPLEAPITKRPLPKRSLIPSQFGKTDPIADLLEEDDEL